jgi:predicted membrane protein
MSKEKTNIVVECILWVMVIVGCVLLFAPFTPHLYWLIVLTFFVPTRIGANAYYYPQLGVLFSLCGLVLIIATCLLGDALGRKWRVSDE